MTFYTLLVNTLIRSYNVENLRTRIRCRFWLVYTQHYEINYTEVPNIGILKFCISSVYWSSKYWSSMCSVCFISYCGLNNYIFCTKCNVTTMLIDWKKTDCLIKLWITHPMGWDIGFRIQHLYPLPFKCQPHLPTAHLVSAGEALATEWLPWKGVLPLPVNGLLGGWRGGR